MVRAGLLPNVAGLVTALDDVRGVPLKAGVGTEFQMPPFCVRAQGDVARTMIVLLDVGDSHPARLLGSVAGRPESVGGSGRLCEERADVRDCRGDSNP